jgi:hypothetical protein
LFMEPVLLWRKASPCPNDVSPPPHLKWLCCAVFAAGVASFGRSFCLGWLFIEAHPREFPALSGQRDSNSEHDKS